MHIRDRGWRNLGGGWFGRVGLEGGKGMGRWRKFDERCFRAIVFLNIERKTTASRASGCYALACWFWVL